MKIVLIVIAVVIVAVVAVLGYYGLFATVSVTERSIEPLWLVYEVHTGEYQKIAEITDRVFNGLKKEGIETSRGFGLYYDKPQNTPAEKLRSIGGCILLTKDTVKLAQIKGKFKVVQFPGGKCLVSEFPFKGMPSIIFAIMKVYPKIGEAMTAKGIKVDVPIMEIYDMPNQKITHVVPYEMPMAYFETYLK
jgi:DNA gyrase inhibitor GyrI